MPLVLVAIDPATANTGVAVWTEGEKEISTAVLRPSDELKKDKGFEGIYSCSRWITTQVGNLVAGLSDGGKNRVEVISEYPPPIGSWSAGLFLLDGLILSRLHRAGLSPYLAHPTRIDTLLTGPIPEKSPKGFQRKTKFTKKERGEYLKEILTLNGIEAQAAPRASKPNPLPTKSGKPRKVRVSTKISSDEIDAAILLLYLSHNLMKNLSLPPGLMPERWELKETPCPR